MGTPPTLAVWKFASCDGCQLSLLDCEDELLQVAGAVRIAHFLEASRAVVEGPYDVSLVEGSITKASDVDRIRRVREQSKVLVTIGACATAGGVQALRNFAEVEEFRSVVYARPEYVATLDRSTSISAHVPVDLELRGCPIDRGQLLNTLSALLAGRKPDLPLHSVCFECKRRGTPCVMVAKGTSCLGPVTASPRPSAPLPRAASTSSTDRVAASTMRGESTAVTDAATGADSIRVMRQRSLRETPHCERWRWRPAHRIDVRGRPSSGRACDSTGDPSSATGGVAITPVRRRSIGRYR
jgi:sulfhydrogenase subunit delta